MNVDSQHISILCVALLLFSQFNEIPFIALYFMRILGRNISNVEKLIRRLVELSPAFQGIEK